MLIDEVRESVNTKGAAITVWNYRADVVAEETLDRGRWEERLLYVIRRGVETVGVEWSTGLTEYQDAEEDPEVYPVIPVTVERVVYVKAGTHV